MIGTVLGEKYEVTSKLAEGGMGSVFEGMHLQTGRVVAIKVLRAKDLEKKITHVRRFQREARAAGSIDTDHIARVIDTGEAEGGRPYIVMERLHGEDLAERLERVSPLPPATAIAIAAQACRGLQKAHDTGVVHRDIKPSNLFLAEREEGEVVVKLLDFGIAKLSDAQLDNLGHDTTLTKAGALLGSPVYMSPEQARGKREIDHRADVWSLGVVLYRMVTGQVPFPDLPLGELLMSICATPVPPVQDVAPWVSPELAEVIHRALRLDPQERYEKVSDFEKALSALVPRVTLSADQLHALDAKSQRAVARRAEITADEPPPPTGAPVAIAAATSERSQTLLLIASGAVIALVAIGAYLALRKPPPALPSPAPTATAP